MLGAGIHHGDLLVVDRSLDPRPGRVVVAVLDGNSPSNAWSSTRADCAWRPPIRPIRPWSCIVAVTCRSGAWPST